MMINGPLKCIQSSEIMGRQTQTSTNLQTMRIANDFEIDTDDDDIQIPVSPFSVATDGLMTHYGVRVPRQSQTMKHVNLSDEDQFWGEFSMRVPDSREIKDEKEEPIVKYSD